MRKINTLKSSSFLFLILFFFSYVSIQAQPTTASKRMEGYQKRQQLLDKSLVKNVEFKSIGPTVFSGRVVDLDVNPKDPSHFYVGYASGGVWKTTNNGITFEPLFDDEMVMSIGDIAVDWERNIIWVGTGENNSSRSSYSGTGMYKSADDGKTWQHIGLEESHHIGCIALHPDNPDIAWVAVLGHLYSSNKERGLYKTTDGGKTWNQTLFVNDNAGGVDLVLSPNNTNTLYAAIWERTRRAWNFVESGEGSGIYKSEDGGDTWELLTTKNSGFPTGEGVGRIGLDIAMENGEPVVFAILDNYFRRPAKATASSKDLTKSDLRSMSKEQFLSSDESLVKAYLSKNNFPRKYNYKKVKSMISSDEIQPAALVEFTEDANSLLFDTPVIGAEIYRTNDGGKKWTKQNEGYLEQVYNSYGYYFGQIRVAPQDPNRVYIMGVPVLKSTDGGKNFESINGANVHSDHHALWVNPSRDGHIILGNDGGVNISYDDGDNWNKCNSPALGQFYYLAVDMERPYNVYGGLQDNGVWKGPSTYRASDRWHASGQYPYKSIMGGDGMQVAVDTRDNNTVYTGFQFGFYFRLNLATGKRTMIKPQHELGERPLRFNWQTPIHLSKHNQDIFYYGANKLYRSFNQGDDYEAISDDLTKGGKKGDVPFGTLATIHESDFQFGLLYTGSDDGLIHISKNGGATWEDISNGLPPNLWAARIQASSHKKERVYLALNNYRSDDFECYIYASDNYGKTWERIGLDLPMEPANVIKEDPKNENLLYVGTDHGLYISLDRGKSFMQMKKGLPAVAVHDVVIHPRDNDLLVGTHGRSIYKTNISALQQLSHEKLAESLIAYDAPTTRSSSRWGNSRAPWREPNVPNIELPVYANSAGKATISILSDNSLSLNTMSVQLEKGINFIPFDLSLNDTKVKALVDHLNANKKRKGDEIKIKQADNKKYYLPKGAYHFEIEKEGKKEKGKFEIK